MHAARHPCSLLVHLLLRPTGLAVGTDILVPRSSLKEVAFLCPRLTSRVILLFQLPVKWVSTTSAALRCPVQLTRAGTVCATEGMPIILKYSSHSSLRERARS